MKGKYSSFFTDQVSGSSPKKLSPSAQSNNLLDNTSFFSISLFAAWLMLSEITSQTTHTQTFVSVSASGETQIIT